MIAVGVDTHKHEHTAAALDHLGQVLGELQIPATRAGYERLVAWLAQWADEVTVGIEGAGSYGAGLGEHLLAQGIAVVEVERPQRSDRRRGKSDSIDARLAAARVLSGQGLSTLRAGGTRQVLAAVLIAYRSCVAERTRALNQLQALVVVAPVDLRERVGAGSGAQLARRLERMRGRAHAPDTERAILSVLRDLASRARALERQAQTYERQLERLIAGLDATLLDEPGVGPISAAKLLVCDPARFRCESAFARANGTAPLPASSGLTVRHRLSRGGDRQANNALHTIARSRCRHDPATRSYLERRMSEGKTEREAMRALKRHLSRRFYKRLVEVPLTS